MSEPALISTNPTNDDNHVLPGSDVNFYFDRPVHAGSGRFVETSGDGDYTFTTLPVSFLVFSGNTVTVPNQYLFNHTRAGVAIAFDTGNILDANGNGNTAGHDRVEFSFYDVHQNQDGSRTEILYDPWHHYAYKQVVFSYDTTNRVTDILYSIRDIIANNNTTEGNHIEYVYDVNNQQRYADAVFYSDAQYAFYDVVYDFRDGTKKSYETDLTGAASYSQIISDFDAQGRRTDVQYANKDGTGNLYIYDVDNTQTYSSIVWSYNSSGFRTDVTYIERDGSQINYHYGSPVILDLDGNGVDLTPLTSSIAHFDVAGTGQRASTAWVGGHDGLLAIDLGADGSSVPDGVIDQAREINFGLWAPGTSSDLIALRQVFDTNHDGMLDSGDARWTDFRVWIDSNHDGISETSEVRTLGDLGIVAINLTPSGHAIYLGDGSTIAGTTAFVRTDGTTGIAGDVTLASVVVSGASSSPSTAAAAANPDDFSFAHATSSARPVHTNIIAAENIGSADPSLPGSATVDPNDTGHDSVADVFDPALISSHQMAHDYMLT